VGFDVESVPNAPWIKQNALFDGPAVVQVSTPDSALVVQLTRQRNQRQSTACTAVSALLSDRTIVKCCTAIEEDMLELYRFNRSSYKVIRSRFDLGGVGSGRGSKQRIGLQRLVRAVLGVEMKKSKKLAMSNWSKPLTKQQVEYAARDAWAGAALIQDLAERHPETFSADSIVRLLRDERPIQEVHKRATRRKKARTQLKTIREQYQQYSAFDLQYKPQKLGLPPIVLEELDRVREVLEETSPDGLIGFDAEPLGLTFDNQRN
jgi:ribonuclease D